MLSRHKNIFRRDILRQECLAVFLTKKMNNNVYLASKPRYEILDGLRGVAAMIVVAFHLFETYSAGPDSQILNHGYLAVDFFFVLSGFVIGYAYDDRWSEMSTWNFFKRRLIRLHPMLIMGTVIGAIFFYLGDSSNFQLIADTPWWKVMLLMLFCCTMLPALKSWDIRGWAETNPLNGATWSLMWEYLANIVYALFVRRFSKSVLAILVVVSAFFTLDICLNLDVFGLLAGRMYAANTVIGGWCIDAEQGYIGIGRLLYPFFCGLLLSRMGKLISVRGGFWWCSLLIAILLCMPCIPGGERGTWTCGNGIYNAFVILVMFPLIVLMGAGSKVTDKRSIAVCKWLGEISYPLYVTHFPLVYVQIAWVSTHKDAPLGTHIFVAVSLFVFAIFMAWAAYKLYDVPVREWLTKKLFTTVRREQ